SYARGEPLGMSKSSDAKNNTANHMTSTLSKPSVVQAEFDNMPALTQESAVIVGVVFDTYIVLQTRSELYFVDQHAAHERLLYDQLCKSVDTHTITQGMLAPYTFSLSAVQASRLSDVMGHLEQIGFELRALSDKDFAIAGVPNCLVGLDCAFFVTSLMHILEDQRSISNTTLLGDKLKQVACKAAIKAGYKIDNREILKLFERIQQTDMQLYCPHGRPIFVQVGKGQLERWFKRVI
ncbi:MAG: hypothetical protein FWD76_05885, partial [Firmicutes bacterium]|nr:hypothetical protein [Bacillota bacterium]